MELKELKTIFKKHADKFCQFDDVKNKRSLRADLHAFMLLDEILPTNDSIIILAKHDEVWLNVYMDEFCECATEDIIIELIQCGVRYDNDNYLKMFI